MTQDMIEDALTTMKIGETEVGAETAETEETKTDSTTMAAAGQAL